MAWQDELGMILRYTVGDIDSPQTYTDNRLEAMLVIAATFVLPQFNFSQTFTADAVEISIVPDPTMPPNPDEWLANFMVFQAAIMITRNELRKVSQSNLRFKEFHTEVDMREIYKAKLELLKELQEVYTRMELQYRMGVRPSGKAVLTPFNIIAGGWRGPIYVYSDRDRFVI